MGALEYEPRAPRIFMVSMRSQGSAAVSWSATSADLIYNVMMVAIGGEVEGNIEVIHLASLLVLFDQADFQIFCRPYNLLNSVEVEIGAEKCEGKVGGN